MSSARKSPKHKSLKKMSCGCAVSLEQGVAAIQRGIDDTYRKGQIKCPLCYKKWDFEDCCNRLQLNEDQYLKFAEQMAEVQAPPNIKACPHCQTDCEERSFEHNGSLSSYRVQCVCGRAWCWMCSSNWPDKYKSNKLCSNGKCESRSRTTNGGNPAHGASTTSKKGKQNSPSPSKDAMLFFYQKRVTPQKQMFSNSEEDRDEKKDASGSDDKAEPNKLQKVLVVLICVAVYDQYSALHKLQNLPGTQTDKARLQKLFNEHYQYDVITNKSGKVTKNGLQKILFEAKMRFKQKQYEYQAILVLFSGHGDLQRLLLSNYHPKYPVDGSYMRCDFESYFNGESQHIPEKVDAYKFYMIDACRGHTLSRVSEKKVLSYSDPPKGMVQGIRSKCTPSWIHPAERTSVIYSNAKKNQSYEVPFDEKEEDVAHHRLTEDTYMKNADWPKWCGIFMNAVWNAFNANKVRGFEMNFTEIEDAIKHKVKRTVVPKWGDFECKVGQIAKSEDDMETKEKMKIAFVQNTLNAQPCCLRIQSTI